MNLCITGERQATSDEWDQIWGNCNYATYFHSREWAEIWQTYSQGKMRSDAKFISFSDGKSALLPFSSRRILGRFFKQHISSPAGTYGGWLSLNDLSENHGGLLHEYIVAHYKNLTWRINPYNSVEASLNVRDAKIDETQVLNLDSGFDAIFSEWTKGHASAARKARKAGAEVREAVTLQDWKVYYGLYEDSLNRWGESTSSRYDWLFFQHINTLASFNIKLWLTTFEDNVVAGALCFYAKKHVVYWHGSALEKYFKLRPVNLLMYEIIRDACERGYRWFDFNPSGGHEGVRKFKKSFGATSKDCPVVLTNSLGNKIIMGLSARMRR